MRYFHISYCLFLWVLLVTTVFSECPIPKKKPYRGRLIYESPHHSNWTMAPENYVLRFKCFRGYVLQGPQVSMCSSNQWTDEVPTCIQMQCSDPPDIENGRYVLQTGVHDAPTIGSTAHYSCNNGYKLENETDQFLICFLFKGSSQAVWKGDRPKCQRLDSCPDPGISKDGYREGECCFTGNKVRYSCKEDFDLVGPEELECLQAGVWSAHRPLCRPRNDHCDLPPPIPHGIAKGDKTEDFYRPYDDIEIICEPGFKYTGSEFVMCEEETGWEEEFGECVEAFCDPPPPLENGTIPEISNTNLTSFPYDFELTYLCDEGFRLVGGDSWRTCDSRGWTGKNPHCELIQCPDPGVPEYGSRIGTNFSIGEKVTFKCFTGFALLGSFERYCMPNGQWGGEVARCDLPSNYCPNPGIPVNGAKNSSTYDMGEQISFRCHEGYSLIGSEIRECLPNRTWSGTELKCIGPNDYDNSAQVRDILKAAVAEKREEQQKKLETYFSASKMRWSGAVAPRIIDLNFPGRLIFYFAFDTSGSVKKTHFKESVALAKAIVKKVGVTEKGARVGALTFSSKANVEFLPVNYNSTEQVLEALDRLNYTGGGTSATSALALLREELIPLTEQVFTKREQKSIIFILTDGKANMGGDPKGEADVLKEDGAEIYCIGVTNSAVLDSLYKIASEPFNEHVFILNNYKTLAYLIQELTEGEIDYSQCGLGLDRLGRQTSRGRIVGGNNAVDPWPWMAAMYLKKPDKEPELSCGGSIITERFILTAAHCLYIPKTEIRREINTITIKLGLTNVKIETNLQEFEVENYFIHDLYVNVNDLYDFDIALIKLQRPIEFNALVRPICLPPKDLNPDTNLYKAGELAVATGWGHKDVVRSAENVNWLTQEDLKQIVLPIQPVERCRQSIRDHDVADFHFTENMFCVGDGEGGNDTCRGDSGGPLMQSQLNKEGYTYWTQIGIVSWGIKGCGLPNTYGFYSHVHQLSDWVQDKLREESAKPENEI